MVGGLVGQGMSFTLTGRKKKRYLDAGYLSYLYVFSIE
jgi:hypothetical protein